MLGYAWDQLRRALGANVQANGSEAGAAARRRTAAWVRVLLSMATGKVAIGSPTPIRDAPAWVTPEIVRGGFATGRPAAAGALLDDEVELARRAGVPRTRVALFAWFLTDDGQRRLTTWLDSGRYRVELPEHAALLVVAQLLRTDRVDDADVLLEELVPWSDRIRFWPFVDDEPDAPGVHVATVAEVAARLQHKRPRPQVEAEREALEVWAPFTDRVLAHWWRTRGEDGAVGGTVPSGWADGARRLLDDYERLAAQHTLTTKHSDPDENLQRLLVGLTERLARPGRAPSRRVQLAVDGMVAKRGAPGSEALQELRAQQAAVAARPSHAHLAQEVGAVLAASGVRGGTPDPAGMVSGVPGAALSSVRAVVLQATQTTLPELLRLGVVRSAEVLAELAPQLGAETVAARHPDPAVSALAKRTYLAFSHRRSVLLVDRQSQVRIDAVPWFRLLEAGADSSTGSLAHVQAVELARLAAESFAGTPLPNALVRELARLFGLAGEDVPLTYELAADIFAGSFSPVFLHAAQEAADLLAGTLYERYYGIDYAAVAGLRPVELVGPTGRVRRSVPSFDLLAHVRAGVERGGWHVSPAVNGTVIEQAQVLTTQNLASLVRHGLRVDPVERARAAWAVTTGHLAKGANGSRLRHRKNAAAAWREVVFSLSLAGPGDVRPFLDGQADDRRLPAAAADAARTMLGGLSDTIDGVPRRRDVFLGWVAPTPGRDDEVDA